MGSQIPISRLRSTALEVLCREMYCVFVAFDNIVLFPSGNPETVYKHTQLLLKLGSAKEAITNWLLFRGIQRYHKGNVDSIRRRLR